jgi:hypothetical protein
MLETIEKLIDTLFSEPYGLDDCMDIGKILDNKMLILGKDVYLGKAREELKQTGSININASHEGVYVAHYRLHSETAINVLNFFINNPAEIKKKEYLENKIISFFKSYEWETWAWKYVEAISDFSPYIDQKNDIQGASNTRARRRRKSH